MDNTYCRCYQGVSQEFWATVFLATLMMVSFNEEDDEYATEYPEKKTKANRRVIFGLLKQKYLDVFLSGASVHDLMPISRSCVDVIGCQKNRIVVFLDYLSIHEKQDTAIEGLYEFL